ncbi:MAG TPA: STAS-like domain-containing protein [Pyrinomonadaceae bacterium]
MKVPVYKIVGDVCMTYRDGERLHAAFREAFEQGDTIELDFDKTRIFVTPFFNASIAPLLEKHSRAEVEERVKILNLPKAGEEPYKHSIENADRYFHDPHFRESLDRVLGNLAAEA